MTASTTHTEFVRALKKLASPSAIPGISRFFWPDPDAHSEDNRFLGVAFGRVFGLAKQFAEMPLTDIELLLESPYFEVRMGAVSVMDLQARAKKTPVSNRQALFELYLRRHDRIN